MACDNVQSPLGLGSNLHCILFTTRGMSVIIIIMKAKIIVTLYIKNVTGALYTVNYNENTLSMSVSVNAAWNSVVLTARQNDCSEVAALTDEGRAFQARAAATGNARSPSVERHICAVIHCTCVCCSQYCIECDSVGHG